MKEVGGGDSSLRDREVGSAWEIEVHNNLFDNSKTDHGEEGVGKERRAVECGGENICEAEGAKTRVVKNGDIGRKAIEEKVL